MPIRRALWTILFICYAGASMWQARRPIPAGEPLFELANIDKLFHFLEAYLFFFLSWKVLTGRRRLVYAFLLAAILPGINELQQVFSATRTASFFDWLAALSGGMVAACSILLLRFAARRSLLDSLRRRILSGLRR